MGVKGILWPAAGSAPGSDGIPFEADFLSFVNDETYGKPPIITTNSDLVPPAASVGKTVVYINPRNIAILKVERTQ